MKLRFFLIFAGMISSSLMCYGQQLRIATVSMERLFNETKETAEVEREINVERAQIQRENNLKLSVIREIEAKIEKIREDLNNDELGERQRTQLIEELQELRQDGVAKERERTEYLQRRNKALNEKRLRQMRGILSRIERAVSERAKEGNYDFIFDSSGKSNQGIPFVLHSREVNDVTEALLKEMNGGK